jgi:glucokinase
MSELVSQIPLFVVLNPKVGLIGAAIHAGQL